MAKGKPYTDEDMAEMSDNPEWTEEDFRTAKPLRDVLPELAASIARQQGQHQEPPKVAVSLRLDRDLVDTLKAGGDGWQKRTNDLLRAAVRNEQEPKRRYLKAKEYAAPGYLSVLRGPHA